MRDYNLLADSLLNSVESLLQSWIPDGKRAGHEYKGLNPTRADSKIGSFSVNLQNGKWADFADGSTGGNLITLYAYLFGTSNSEAYDALSGEDSSFQTYATNKNQLKPKKEIIEEWKIVSLPFEKPSGIHFELGNPIASYKYEDFYIFRYLKPDGTKDIRPMTYRENIHTGEREWRWKAKPENRAIYNKHKIGDNPILIVEGEKAGNVIVAGYTVVSWAGGSNAIDKTDWRPLYNRADVYFWADRDSAGFKTVDKIKEKLPLVNVIAIDFSVQDGQDIADITHKEIQDKLSFFTKPHEEEVKRIITKEIVTAYDTKYPDIKPIETGVIIARTGSGKTFQFEGKGGYLIIVPRTEQTTVEAGENLNYLIDKTIDSGSIITYNKFYGHYNSSEEFRQLIDMKVIKVVVDEAHLLIAIPSKMHKFIYHLDAVFMSGTLETFFRKDLQRYKYKPKHPEIIYYTNGLIPKIDGSLIFVDNAKALMNNYAKDCIVSSQHGFENVNLTKCINKQVFATSCIREGVSVKNENFKACMVYSKGCRFWSTKDIIQGVHRIRLDGCLRLVSEKPQNQYDKHIDMDWWLNMANSHSSDDLALNAVFGEFYSKLIKTTHKYNDYIKADEYGMACYLANMTRNNYDEDFYIFREYEGEDDFLDINLDTKGVIEEDEEGSISRYAMKKDGTKWEFDEKDADKFYRWAVNYETGLIHKFMKLNKHKNLHELYSNSRLGKHLKKEYNVANQKRGDKFSIDLFYLMMNKLVKLELKNELTGEILERIGSKTSHKNVSVKVVGICAISSVKMIAEV